MIQNRFVLMKVEKTLICVVYVANFTPDESYHFKLAWFSRSFSAIILSAKNIFAFQNSHQLTIVVSFAIQLDQKWYENAFEMCDRNIPTFDKNAQYSR